MGLQINTNVAAMNAYRNLSSTQGTMSTSLERLSSGLRINRAADDAAGLAISEKLRAQANGLNQATANAQDGISLIQTAEGALNESHSILQRMRQLSVQAANDTNSDADRTQIQKEVAALSTELGRLSTATQFNGKDLLTGTFAGKFQIGANAGQEIAVSIGGTDLTSLGLDAGLKATSASGAVATSVGVTTPTGNFTIKANNDVVDSAGGVVGAYTEAANIGTVTFNAGNGAGVVVFDKSAVSGGTGSFSVTNGVDVSTQAKASGSVTSLSTRPSTRSPECAPTWAPFRTVSSTP